MAEQISVVLAGMGGYGNLYLSALLGAPRLPGVRLAAGVDPFPEKCSRLADLKAQNIPVFSSLEDFYRTGRADLAVLATPIHLHCPQTCLALAHGSHVLCEKPLGATPAQAVEMIRARDRAGKIVAIGYQWSFSPAVQALKQDTMAGRLGRPIRLRTLVLWPRDEKYYRRNSWAGAKQDAQGNWILDSPVNNAASHYLHNVFYILGKRPDRSAWPLRVRAELYRAHPIQNYDTAVLRAVAEGGVEILFAATHAGRQRRGPLLHYEFENATVKYGEETDRRIIARFKDGSVKDYGAPDDDNVRKLWETISALRSGAPVPCGVEAASAQTACMFGVQESVPDIRPFPESLIRVEGEPGSRKTWVEGLDEVLTRCYEEFRLPSELQAPWAAPGREVDTAQYRFGE